MSREYRRDFDRIQYRFARLFDNITKMIKRAQVSIENLKRYLTFFPDLEVDLQDADTIAKVMRVVQHHSSFTNTVLLERIVDHINIPEARKEIDAYVDFIEEFCRKILPKHSYATLLADQSRHLRSSETITFELEWETTKKTLTDIRSLILVSLNTLHISPPVEAQTSTKPPSDVEGSRSSVETHNMQELIKKIEDY